MRILVLGKVGNITHWFEDTLAGFRASGHDVCLGVTRNPALGAVEPAIGRFRARRILSAVRRFRPNFILAIMPYLIPRVIMEEIAALPARPPLFGWVGDIFGETDRSIANLLDLVAYTDTALIARHDAFGFRAPTLFLPHAATPRSIDRVPAATQRSDEMVFVASVTPRRLELVQAVNEPVVLYGPGWRKIGSTRHRVIGRRVSDVELARIYPAHRAALNVANEQNVLVGLNQRNFTPYLSATPVLTDAQPDLERCFEPGREVLVFNDAAEMNEHHAKLRREPGFADAIGQRGRARVLAEHCYAHRLAAFAAAL